MDKVKITRQVAGDKLTLINPTYIDSRTAKVVSKSKPRFDIGSENPKKWYWNCARTGGEFR